MYLFYINIESVTHCTISKCNCLLQKHRFVNIWSNVAICI